MKLRPLFIAISMAAVLPLAACSKNEPSSTEQTTEAGSTALQIPGLPDEKAQASYVIGMTFGKQLEEIQDEVDINMVVRGMKDELSERAPLVRNEEQAMAIMTAFMQRMQARAEAKAAEVAAANAEAGTKFLAENASKEGVQVTESGLQYQVLEQGDGAKPSLESQVVVHYTGKLLDGTVFDDSTARGEPVSFPLGQVVKGWQEGLQLMPAGSKYRFWIPSELAYGATGSGPIPPNSTLMFDVELLEVVKR